jgi:hypothetical protein
MKLVLLAMFAAACDRGRHDPPAPAAPEPARAAPAEAAVAHACTLAPAPLRMPAAKRLVAIGDIHGDLAAARSALRAAQVIDDHDAWIGHDTVVVQTGDVLDRGDDESQILALLDKLAGEAKQAGGALVPLIGNHELMNAAGDFRYVTPGGMRDFDGDRLHELGPGGTWATRIAAHEVVMIVGDTVLSHAGVLPGWVDQLDAVNLSARCWLAGQGDVPAALTADDSPVWTRAYGMDDVDCAALTTALDKLGAKRMVVGHTVQKAGITSACDGKLWRIDVGLAKLYGGPIEVLEISAAASEPKVLRGKR